MKQNFSVFKVNKKQKNISIPLPPINSTSFSLNKDSDASLDKIIISEKEIRIVYFGTPDLSAYILERLVEFCQSSSKTQQLYKNRSKSAQFTYSIVSVVTSPDKPVGRHQDVVESAVARVAHRHNIPVLKPEKLNEEFLKNNILLLNCDLFIVAAYGKIIPQKMLDIPRLGSINVHGSILPKYRGASPIQAAILNGDDKTGVTIMLMNAQMDHGPILATREISISGQDNFQSLSKKIADSGADLLIETLPQFVQGEISPKEQEHEKATFTKLIKKEDGYFDINNPPSKEKLDRMIRAYYPWPNVWTKWKGKVVKFYPGGLVQMEGKRAVKLEDFLHGYPDFPIKKI